MTMEGYYRELDYLYAQLDYLHRHFPGDRVLILEVVRSIRLLRQNKAHQFQAPEP